MYLLIHKFILFALLSFECSFVRVVSIVCFLIMSQHKLLKQIKQQTTPQMYSNEWGTWRNPRQENRLKWDSKWKMECNQQPRNPAYHLESPLKNGLNKEKWMVFSRKCPEMKPSLGVHLWSFNRNQNMRWENATNGTKHDTSKYRHANTKQRYKKK